jgi:hypothetical protein
MAPHTFVHVCMQGGRRGASGDNLGPILLLVGGGPPEEVEVTKLAGLTWRHVAYMSDSELAVAYSGAAAHVQVSFAEGFGLTVLEAISVSAWNYALFLLAVGCK